MHVPWGFGEDCWHPGTVRGHFYLSQGSGYGRTQWWVADPGLCMGVLLSHLSMYYRYVIIIVIINITIIIIITHVCFTSNHWLSLLKLSSALSTPWAHLLYSIYSGGRNHSYILCTIPKVISWAHIILRDQWAFLASVTLVVAKYLYVCWRYWCICSNKPFLMWIWILWAEQRCWELLPMDITPDTSVTSDNAAVIFGISDP